jgi:alpha-L-fucosidase
MQIRNRLSCALACVASLSLVVVQAAGQARYEPSWASLDKRPTPEWYLDAKFGVFIHWGIYSVPGWGAPKQYAEWYWNNLNGKQADNPWRKYHDRVWGREFEYPQFAPRFKCEHYNPDEWADILARSGAKYIVPTSKHHDGFAIWPSAEADKTWGRAWSAVSTGPKRDLLGDLAKACRQRDLKFGFYYSLYEWYNPLWLSDRKRYVAEHMIPQFKDVVTRYAPAIIFSDGEWDMPSADWRSEELLAWLFNESPSRTEVVINDRWGKECRHKHGGYFTTEYGAGLANDSHAWEESRGMGYSYGWNRAENIDDYKGARELILVLIDLVSRGGNFLLDIGPTGDGRIPVIMQDRLIQIGNWLRVNGEAIYGTRFAGRDCQWSEGQRPGQKYGEYMIKYELMSQVGFAPREGKAVKQAFFTKKPDALYAITPGWPGKQLVLRSIKAPSNPTVTLLGHEGKLPTRTEGETLTIDLPQLNSEQLPSQPAYAFQIIGGAVLPEPSATGGTR